MFNLEGRLILLQTREFVSLFLYQALTQVWCTSKSQEAAKAFGFNKITTCVNSRIKCKPGLVAQNKVQTLQRYLQLVSSV
jgi:hypothetical protein